MEVRMLNSVSFAARGIYDKPNFDAPQGNPRPSATTAPTAQPTEAPKKSHKAAKVIVGTLVAAAAVATALALGSKHGAFDASKIADRFSNLASKDWAQKFKEPAKTVLGALDTAGKAIGEYAEKGKDFVVKKGQTIANTVQGWFHKA